jgi:hypothetical protein
VDKPSPADPHFRLGALAGASHDTARRLRSLALRLSGSLPPSRQARNAMAAEALRLAMALEQAGLQACPDLYELWPHS